MGDLCGVVRHPRDLPNGGSTMPRTTRDFSLTSDTWPRIDAWAAQNRFRLVQTLPLGRIYQRDTGIFITPIMVSMENAAQGVHLEAWIRVNGFIRLCWFFLAQPELTL